MMIMVYIGGLFLLLIVFMLGGYIILWLVIKSWWIWGYWIFLFVYVENVISINEMFVFWWSKVECYYY